MAWYERQEATQKMILEQLIQLERKVDRLTATADRIKKSDDRGAVLGEYRRSNGEGRGEREKRDRSRERYREREKRFRSSTPPPPPPPSLHPSPPFEHYSDHHHSEHEEGVVREDKRRAPPDFSVFMTSSKMETYSREKLRDMFSLYGNIRGVHKWHTAKLGEVARIEFDSKDSVATILAKDTEIFEATSIMCERYVPRETRYHNN